MGDKSPTDLMKFLLEDEPKPAAAPTPVPVTTNTDITGGKQTEEQLMIAYGLIKPKKPETK